MCVLSEQKVENNLILQLIDLGYEKVNIEDTNELNNNFRKQFNKHNKEALEGIELSDKEFERLLAMIGGKSIFDSSKLLRDKLILKRDNDQDVYVSLFNWNDWCKNIFQVTNQINDEGKYRVRYDVTILVNGLPLIQIELKRAGVEIREAFNQVNRYRKTALTGLMRFIQLFIVSNTKNTRYFANSDKEISPHHMFVFTDFYNKPINNIEDFTQHFLERCQVGKVISRYIITNESAKALMVLRPYQMNAVEELVKRATETNNNGYVWHTTGSGKTLTSFKTSQILSRTEGIDKVIFLVDRKDLDSQTLEEFNHFEPGSVDETSNTSKLVEMFKREDKRLIITTIQKLSNALRKDFYASTMDKFRDKKIIFIIDECHRSQFGDMHKDMLSHFTNAQFLGFTGTPIFEQNKSADGRVTADLFEKCLHTYLIKDAIRDGNVLGFHVDYISTIKGKNLEGKEFERMIVNADLKEVFNHPERQRLIAEDILTNFNTRTRNKQFCTLFAVDGIPNVISYYNKFKEFDHDLKVAAIYSFQANDEQDGVSSNSREELDSIMIDYNTMFGRNYSTDTFAAYFADVSRKVKDGKIDILIVANMFLTGFDSKPLNTLYVDKNMQYHGLIQAFSRTNRTFNEAKQHGNIVCYRNLKNNVDEAIRLFSSTDGVEVTLVQDYSFYLEEFTKYVQRLIEFVPTPDHVDLLERDEEIANFVYRFRDVARLQTKMSTFVEFDWKNNDLPISESLFIDYKTKYIDINRRPKTEKESILDGIDFELELLLQSKINVSYVLNLLEESRTITDNEEKIKALDEIIRMIDSSDNPALMSKKEFILNFILTQMPQMDHKADLYDVFKKAEEVEMGIELDNFAKENDIESSFLKEEIASYTYSGQVQEDRIRKYGVTKGLTIIKQRKFTKDVSNFIVNITSKYE